MKAKKQIIIAVLCEIFVFGLLIWEWRIDDIFGMFLSTILLVVYYPLVFWDGLHKLYNKEKL